MILAYLLIALGMVTFGNSLVVKMGWGVAIGAVISGALSALMHIW
ncbi:hypothetical protein [Halomonas sp. 3A7M]|nr:hypothetical protein [Halomonas sp. 3A7M]